MINILKRKVKQQVISQLHCVDGLRYSIARDVSVRGVKMYANFSFEQYKEDTLRYVRGLKVGDFGFRYASSVNSPVLYASICALMLEGLLGVLENPESDRLTEWGNYLLKFQREDGYFYDRLLEGEQYDGKGSWNDGWGKRHLIGHMIIALARANVKPKYPFGFLKPYYSADYLRQWMMSFSFASGSAWTSSNYFMNLYTALQYSRDFMADDKAAEAIKIIKEWLAEKQSQETGMWHEKLPESIADRYDAVRGAYHLYPLFSYEGEKIAYARQIVDLILPLQNGLGGFCEESEVSSACMDIDAMEPLIRCSRQEDYRSNAVRGACIRSLIWNLANRNDDGGFSFVSHLPHFYGDHPLTTSRAGESSLFATWFRTLLIAYICDYLKFENGFDVKSFPGYEVKL